MSVVPSSALGLHLQDHEFRLCLQYWLGLRMTEDGLHCPICHTVADPFGDHRVGCGGNGDRIHRHDSIRDAVFSAAQSAGRPLLNWRRGRPAALDVTVISTLQQLTLQGDASTPGYALVSQASRIFPHARKILRGRESGKIRLVTLARFSYDMEKYGWLARLGMRVRKGSGPLMLRPVVQLVSVLSLWSLSLWVDGVKRQLTPSPVLVIYWVNVWESLLVNLSDTFSSDVLYPYGEATRPSGFIVIPFILRQLMVSYD